MRREKFLENYRKKIQKMNISELLFEFDSVRKKINPRCKRWNSENANLTGYERKTDCKKYYCKNCEHSGIGERSGGRFYYFCDNPKRTKQNSSTEEGFVCFMDTKKREPKIKTSPIWCPLKCRN